MADEPASPLDGEPLTDELLDRLLSSDTPEAYLTRMRPVKQTLPEYLDSLLAEKGVKKSKVIEEAGLNKTFGYQIFEGTRTPGRDNAIMLALGMRCTLRETQRLLKLDGLSELWCKNRRDAIIIFCIEHGYSRERCDRELYELNEQTLFPENG